MKSNERTAKYFDCIVTAYATRRGQGTQNLPPLPLADLLQHLELRILTAAPFLRSNRGRTETWHISDIKLKPDHSKAIILVNRSDRLGADQAISDPVAGEFLVAQKRNNQGNASSAHIAVLLKPVKPNTYLTVVEEATGIGTKDVAQIMSQMLNKSRAEDNTFFMVNDPSGDPALALAARYSFNFVGHPSDDFINELETGQIQGIELSDFQARDQAFDEDGYTVEKKKIIELSVVNTGSSIRKFIDAICESADRQDFASLRVKFKDSNNYLRSVEIDSRSKNLVNEERFIKKARVEGFGGRLNTGYDVVHPEIRDKLWGLI